MLYDGRGLEEGTEVAAHVAYHLVVLSINVKRRKADPKKVGNSKRLATF